MKTTGRVLCACIIIATVILMPACKNKAGGDFSRQESEAVVIATSWLHLVDDGKYSQSWSETAGMFRKSVSQEKWIRLMSSSRKPLGETISRALHSREYLTSLPGAPDGEYVVIMFETSFKNKKDSIETITPMKDKDGKWRVSGYYIK